jgi:transcription elongation factor Elf1
MKHRKEINSRPSKEAEALVRGAVTELFSDAIRYGWDGALSNLREKTAYVKAENYVTDDISEEREDGAFVNETLKDGFCCPYCMGQSEYRFLDNNVTTYKCSSCGRTYEIEYSMSSTGIDYNNIIDIRKNDEDSLFIGGDR